MTDHKAGWVPRQSLVDALRAHIIDLRAEAACAPNGYTFGQQAASNRAGQEADHLERLLAAAPAASEAQAAAEDRILYGTSIMLDGKRIDPRTVQIDPAASEGEDGRRLAHHCQNGRADVCRASQRDGVVCPDDSCDIDDGVREKDAPAAQVAATPFRNMPDGATFEEYRDKLATGDLTPIDQMAFDNMLYDLLEAATPKHDEGLVRPMGEDARVPDDFRGWAAPAYRAGWNDRHAAALATQPAARRVTDERPNSCRNRLRDEGKPHPRSGCHACKTGGMTGCPYERGKSLAQPAEGVSGGEPKAIIAAARESFANGGDS